MKKFLALVIVAIMMLSLSVCSFATRGLVYEAPYGTAVIDGVGDDAAWANAAWTDVDLSYDGNSPTDSTLRAKIIHDDTYVYVLCEVHDCTVAENMGDFVEFYLDEDNCHNADEWYYCPTSYQLRMAVSGDDEMGSNGSDKNFEDLVVASAKSGSGTEYVVEFQIKTINAPAAGTTFGLEFMYNDASEDAEFLHALRWNCDTVNGDPAPYLCTWGFGELTFLAQEEAEDEPADDVDGDATDDTDTDVDPAPATSDAAIVAAVAVLAIAAGVVITKKH